MFKIVTIPFNTKIAAFDEETLNKFCLNKKIKNYRTEFFVFEGCPYWTLFLEYDMAAEHQNPDVTADLNEEEKVIFEKLKMWRRQKAEEEGIPVYIIATNNELKDLLKQRPKSLEVLKNVRGFGVKKIEKYGKDILGILSACNEKT